MSSTLFSESSLMYFPTHEMETYRMLGVMGDWKFKNYSYRNDPDFINDVGGTMMYRQISQSSADSGVYNLALGFFDYWIKSGRVDLIKKHLTMTLSTSGKTSIVDPFAGKAEWLKTWKEFLSEDEKHKFVLVANEIENNRFKDAKKVSDYAIHSSFEEVEFPKNSFGFCLFNPPYGTTNGERNVTRYLNMLIERELLVRKENSYSSYGSQIIFVIRIDDAIENLETILRNFIIRGVYRVNPEEFDKFKQIVIYATCLKKAGNTSYETMKLQEEYSNWKRILSNPPEFEMKMYESISNYGSMTLPAVDFRTAFENIKYVKNREAYLSTPNTKAWEWLKDKTDLKKESVAGLTTPRKPKPSEIANLIAAGFIDNEVVSGNGKHIAVGGVKTLVKREEIEYNDEEGNKITEVKVTKQSVPYLNILYANELGILQVKELVEEE